MSAIFNENFEIRERCKGVHCVDLGESFPTSIYYLLANFGFDTAENEPCKVCPLSVYRSPWCPEHQEKEGEEEQISGTTILVHHGMTRDTREWHETELVRT